MSALGLGIDAGGTKSRWALVDAAGTLMAEGEVAGMSGLQMHSEAGRVELQSTLAALALAVLAQGRPQAVCAGITGVDQQPAAFNALIAAPFGLAPERVSARSDIDIAYRDLFAPGEGYVVYAGTGSVAAYIDATGTLHRAGGRGAIVDDAGSGFWIAREAMQAIWRREDESPGAWRASPLAVEMFDRIGASDWASSRAFFYGRERGDIGKLALAVALTAERDAEALRILQAAGRELARLALALIGRFGPRPVGVAGRAAQLHPAILQSMRAALPAGAPLTLRVSEAHLAAARIAAGATPPPSTNQTNAQGTPA